jgi:hypothetical protein
MTHPAPSVETMSRENAVQEYPPRRQRRERPEIVAEANQKPAEQGITAQDRQTAQEMLTPKSLQIAIQLDTLERERADAISERNEGRARIEQFQHRQAELIREKEMLEIRLADQQRSTEAERNERIRLSDAMHSVILLLQQKLTQPAKAD